MCETWKLLINAMILCVLLGFLDYNPADTESVMNRQIKGSIVWLHV